MSLVYPNIESLIKYKDFLQESNFTYLPPLDDSWAEDMFSMFELVKLIPECQNHFAYAAANLFFKIAKNHKRYDGNKRSAICCLIYFVFSNERHLDLSSKEIEELALSVASSEGNTQALLIPRLTKLFEIRFYM